ncbi:hypothetical protein [Lactiplantibacillus plantarum]|uniref:hypothetical protein n=1 Tax=Lactiplantibacillus plantarum TaxID=1590 RepID=UPI000B3E7042|nr:hypothetical protein [Lactiplantibacillus plantarum]ARW13398.1 hypothetical protein S100434_01249 [Lactiplantibacillus plantarum subsp. plantarum]QHM20578.1 hypothetical protein C7M31_00014 [Lactiplantibacillus plantarum]QHM23527.1 hypothetical protein C7M32_00006 [Lactiplantibacillus plantarum]QHM26491.1 hypothetical protein C7M33_00013 [Lactiplantibacillus plantarum]
MNLKQAAILEYSFNELLHSLNKDGSQKCVWCFNGEIFTASFYKVKPFKDDRKRFDYDEAFSEHFFKGEPFNVQETSQFNNLPLFLSNLKAFISSALVNEDDLVDSLFLRNVSFFRKELGNFDFYLFPEDTQIEIVSTISSETLDQNV